jgi:predicted Zn-dependent protease
MRKRNLTTCGLGILFKTGLLLAFCFSHNLEAFYYVHEMTVLPEIFLRSYQERHHLSDHFKELFDRASRSYYQMDYKRAEQVYNTLLLINSRDIIALDRIAQVYLRQGRYELAQSALQRLLNIEPNYFPAYHLSGMAHLYMKNPRAAIQQAKFLIERSEAFSETYAMLLCSLFMLKQYDNTVAISTIAKEAGSKAPQFDFFPVLIDFVTGQQEKRLIKEAFFFKSFENHPDIELYRFIIAVLTNDQQKITELKTKLQSDNFPHPTYPYMFLLSAFELIGQVIKKENLPETVYWLTDKLIEAEPEFILPYRISTEFFMQYEDYSTVIEFAEKGLKKFNSYIPFHEFISKAAFYKRDFEKAAESLDICLQHRRNDIDLIAFQAIIMLMNEQPDTAYRNIMEAMTKDTKKSNPFVNTAFGYFLIKSKRTIEAAEPLKEAIRIKKDYYLPYDLLIGSLIQNGNYREAYNYATLGITNLKEEFIYRYAIQIAQRNREFFRMAGIAADALNFFPGNKFFAHALAQANVEQGDFEKALKAMDIIGFSTMEEPVYMSLYLDILYELGRLNEAFEKVQTLLRFKPDQKDYLDFLARYYINTREVDKAIAQYEKIARLASLSLRQRSLYQPARISPRQRPGG